MAGLLKIDECLGDFDELRLQSLATEAGSQFRRNVVLRKHLCHRLHVSMSEGAPQAIAE